MDAPNVTLTTLEEMLRCVPRQSWVLCDRDGMVVYGVGPEGGVVGHGPREGTHLFDYVHPDDLPRVLQDMAYVLAHPGEPFTDRARVKHGDGTWRVFEVTAVNRLDDATVGAIVVHTVEVTDVPPLADDLIGSLAEAVPTPILVADQAGYVLFSNSAARTLLGDDFDAVTSQLAGARADGTTRLTFELGPRWIHARIAERSEGWVAMLDDVTAQKDAEDHLYRLAMTDQLTGVSNRAAFDAKLRQVLDATGDKPVSVIFVDLDGFKQVNDRHGHAAGDKVLQVVAARLKTCVRPGDTVARIGGDEFGVICPGLTAEDATGFADRLVNAVRERVSIGESRVVVGASAGSATSPPAPSDAAGLLAAADKAMYRDKTIELWHPVIEL